MHGIRYDAIHDEIVVPHQFGQAVLVFRGGASGEEPPIRVIQGSLTQMMAPDRVDIDPVNNEILVPEEDHLLVFPREANGNTAPKRVLRTQGASYSESNIDPVRNLLVIGGRIRNNNQRTDAIMVFNRTDSGTMQPRHIIGGPRSRFSGAARMALNVDRGLAFDHSRERRLVRSELCRRLELRRGPRRSAPALDHRRSWGHAAAAARRRARPQEQSAHRLGQISERGHHVLLPGSILKNSDLGCPVVVVSPMCGSIYNVRVD